LAKLGRKKPVTAATKAIYPIPTSALGANENLKQNPDINEVLANKPETAFQRKAVS
jgi:hypothetical protein